MTQDQRLDRVTFYDFPWDAPTTAVVEHAGTFYDVREGWGCSEGWTNNYIALPLSEEEVERYSDNMTEISDREVQQSWKGKTLDGILDAVLGEK
jgi:hypothetical protein